MPKPLAFLIVALVVTTIISVGLFSSYIGARQIIRPAPGTKMVVPAFAYAPSPHQTDATPCLTASGTRVRRGTVAANFLPLGTILEIDGSYFIVEDRMHPRYNQAIDIFKPATSEARNFGTRKVEITIVDYGKPGQTLPLPQGVQAGVAQVAPPVIAEQSTLPIPQEHVNNLIEVEGQAAADSPGIFEQWQGGLHYLQRLIRAGSPGDVNRFDVKCFEE